MTRMKTGFLTALLVLPLSWCTAGDFFGSDGQFGSSAGVGISAGVHGWKPTLLINTAHDPQYNKLATFFLVDYQKDFLVLEGRYGFSSNLGLFSTSPEYENHLSALVGLATPPGVLNASLLTGFGVDLGSYHKTLVRAAFFNNTYEDKVYLVPSIPVELNLSVLLWGWGLGLQYHGEHNTEFTSIGLYLMVRQQS